MFLTVHCTEIAYCNCTTI